MKVRSIMEFREWEMRKMQVEEIERANGEINKGIKIWGFRCDKGYVDETLWSPWSLLGQ